MKPFTAFLKQPTWVGDIRPFRAVMMPLDLPPRREEVVDATTR